MTSSINYILAQLEKAVPADMSKPLPPLGGVAYYNGRAPSKFSHIRNDRAQAERLDRLDQDRDAAQYADEYENTHLNAYQN